MSPPGLQSKRKDPCLCSMRPGQPWQGCEPGSDLYIQTETKPDCSESHLLHNKSVIRLWAPNMGMHPTAPQDGTAGRAWARTEIWGTVGHGLIRRRDPAKDPFSFPLLSSLALHHAVFPSCSLSWHPLALPNSSLSLISQICHCPFLIFCIFLPHPTFPSAVFCTRFYIFLATIAGKQWRLPLPMVTICPFIWANMTKIHVARRNYTRPIRFAWII